ncbi:MAG TPA: DUF1496 domain-containing protein [Burkholderiales bacterium]|nr:DUF1496 domain-containing protein [Burkholderiales bacterium]
MPRNIPRVGSPDPERKNSPILDEEDEEIDPELELETGVCYFNDVAYPLGSYVLSGSELLHCEERGVWVRKGEIRPE